MSDTSAPTREEILRRDQYRCQNDECRKTESQDVGVDLQAHHIKPKKWGGPDEGQNLITVCNTCHWMLHRKEDEAVDGRLPTSLIGSPRKLRSQVYRKEDMDTSGCVGAIVDVLSQEGTMKLKEIIEETGYSRGYVGSKLNSLRIAGHVKKENRGVYSYVTKERVEQNIRNMEEADT